MNENTSKKHHQHVGKVDLQHALAVLDEPRVVSVQRGEGGLFPPPLPHTLPGEALAHQGHHADRFWRGKFSSFKSETFISTI